MAKAILPIQDNPRAGRFRRKRAMGSAITTIRGMTIKRLISWVSATFMIFGGVIPFIPQSIKIYANGTLGSFSLFVCFTLLIANILRILFWFGKRYEMPLLIQSIVINVAMLAMIYLCVNVRNNQNKMSERHGFSLFDWRPFWQWTDFLSYVEFLLALSTILSFVTFLFLDCEYYVESLGYLALSTEAMLGLPQVLKNHCCGSTAGISKWMLLSMMAGDTFKTGYFVLKEAPFQFWLCGSLQMLMDIVLLSQMYWFSAGAILERGKPFQWGAEARQPAEMACLALVSAVRAASPRHLTEMAYLVQVRTQLYILPSLYYFYN